MEIIKTGEMKQVPSQVMVVYGEGGVGKTTFASTAKKPLLLDFENGTKYFGLRGINIDTVQIKEWQVWGNSKNPKPDQDGTMRDPDLIKTIRGDQYDTIVIDPIGEAMEKLIASVAKHPDTKMRQKDGSPTMAGWGYVKRTFKDFIKFLRDSGKHVILIAHIEEKDDDGRLVKRPLIATKISQDIVNMVDIVGYMTTRQNEDGVNERVIYVDSTNDKYTAKDRSEQLGSEITPDFVEMINLIGSKADLKPVEDNDNATENEPEEPKEVEDEESIKEDENEPENEEDVEIEKPEDWKEDEVEEKGTEDIDDQLKIANKKKNGTSKKGK